MVARALLLGALSLALPALAVDDVDATDERGLRVRLAEAERAHAKRARELKQDQVHLLVPPLSRSGKNALSRETSGAANPGNSRLKDESPPADATAAQGSVGKTKGVSIERVHGNPRTVETAKPESQTAEGRGGQGRRKGAVQKNPNLSGKPAAVAHAAGTETAVRRAQSDYYFPPSARTGKPVVVKLVGEDFPEDGRRIFGIPMGTEIKAKVRRTSTNVQPGLIELLVSEPVWGEKRALPAGTKLFATPSTVRGSSRLFLRVQRGITPRRVEFRVNAVVYDRHNVAGLAGIVQNDGRALARSTASGASAMGAALLEGVADASVAGRAADAFGGGMLDEVQQQWRAELDRPTFIISAQPQEAIVVIEASF